MCIAADILKVRRVLKKELQGNDAILHFTAEGYAVFALFLVGLKFEGMIMTTHGTYSVLPLINWKTRRLYKKTYQKLDKIISVSNFTKRHLLNYAGSFIPENKIEVILNGVDFVDRILPDRGGHDKCVIISIGEVKQRKGAHHLVRVAGRLKERGDIKFKVLFIGDFNKDSEYCRKLLEFIKSFVKKVEEASVWLHALNKRSAKKNVWGANYKKFGAKYLLSGEHYLQRSAG